MLLPEVELHRNELPVPRPGSAWRNIAIPLLKRARDRRELPGVYHDVSRNFAGHVTRLGTVQLACGGDAREYP